MASTSKWFAIRFCIISCLIVVSHAFTPCSISSKLQHSWELYTSQDGVDFTRQNEISFISTAMFGFQLVAFPNLNYYCYKKSGSYYTFRSEDTTLFDDYKVYIVFCWYFKKVTSSIYNIEDMTDPVIVGSDDHAKAYLDTESDPEYNDICQKRYSSKVGLTAPYKQIRKVVVPTWKK